MKMIRTKPNLVRFLKEKANTSACTYKISAVAFDRKGNVLGHATNKHSFWNVIEKTNDGIGRGGTARHAERILMGRYNGIVKTIVICRVGKTGEIRPIDPCDTCQKVADKLGVKIISVCS